MGLAAQSELADDRRESDQQTQLPGAQRLQHICDRAHLCRQRRLQVRRLKLAQRQWAVDPGRVNDGRHGTACGLDDADGQIGCAGVREVGLHIGRWQAGGLQCGQRCFNLRVVCGTATHQRQSAAVRFSKEACGGGADALRTPGHQDDVRRPRQPLIRLTLDAMRRNASDLNLVAR